MTSLRGFVGAGARLGAPAARARARLAAPAALAALALAGTAAAAQPGGQQDRSQGPGRLLRADVLIVSRTSLPAGTAAAVAKLGGVLAARPLDAARIQVNGRWVAMLGVDPVTFRQFTPRPTAAASKLWASVAAGGIAVSYTMGKQDKLPSGGTVRVSGRTLKSLRVGGFGTVGIGGVDAVVSDQVARSLGFPAANAVLVSAPGDRVATLVSRIKAHVPRTALVEPLVSTAPSGRPAAAGVAGSTAGTASVAGAAGSTAGAAQAGAGLSLAQLTAMLRAAVSRVGMPYVWGAAGPRSFDCSGLVQWSFAQAGVVMPRVAADQARTGPLVPVSQLQPGDLLFYRTDPTAPSYISHVAIYLGRGLMIQAPQPGQDVQVVPADVGSEFAGAVRVSPAIAAQVAASPLG
ncbi:MAG: C40 family peptidase [Streptosporangiales bacterium]